MDEKAHSVTTGESSVLLKTQIASGKYNCYILWKAKVFVPLRSTNRHSHWNNDSVLDIPNLVLVDLVKTM